MTSGHRGVPRAVLWTAGLLLVPTALAGAALLVSAPGIAEDLRARSAASLEAAGIAGVDVQVRGRDVVLEGVPWGGTADAVAAVGAVEGVREVVVPPGSEVAPPTPAPPVSTPDPARQVAAEVAALVAAQPLLFGPDDPTLTPAAAATVARMAELLRAAPAVRVELEGHAADTPGSRQAAVQLAEARARAVAEALAAAGIDPSRIVARGAGDTRPLSTLEASRRVEVTVASQPSR